MEGLVKHLLSYTGRSNLKLPACDHPKSLKYILKLQFHNFHIWQHLRRNDPNIDLKLTSDQNWSNIFLYDLSKKVTKFVLYFKCNHIQNQKKSAFVMALFCVILFSPSLQSLSTNLFLHGRFTILSERASLPCLVTNISIFLLSVAETYCFTEVLRPPRFFFGNFLPDLHGSYSIALAFFSLSREVTMAARSII